MSAVELTNAFKLNIPLIKPAVSVFTAVKEIPKESPLAEVRIPLPKVCRFTAPDCSIGILPEVDKVRPDCSIVMKLVVNKLNSPRLANNPLV